MNYSISLCNDVANFEQPPTITFNEIQLHFKEATFRPCILEDALKEAISMGFPNILDETTSDWRVNDYIGAILFRVSPLDGSPIHWVEMGIRTDNKPMIWVYEEKVEWLLDSEGKKVTWLD